MLYSWSCYYVALLDLCNNVGAELDLKSCISININLYFLWCGFCNNKRISNNCTKKLYNIGSNVRVNGPPKNAVAHFNTKQNLSKKPFAEANRLHYQKICQRKLCRMKLFTIYTDIYLAQNLLKKFLLP